MLALYRWGARPTRSSPTARRGSPLVEELGIEPGRELRDLEQAILRQEDALELVSAPPERPGAEPARSWAATGSWRSCSPASTPRAGRGRGGPRRRRARDRQEPAGGRVRDPGQGAGRAGAVGTVLGGRRCTRLLAVGAVAARLPAGRRRGGGARAAGHGRRGHRTDAPRTARHRARPAAAALAWSPRARGFGSSTRRRRSCATRPAPCRSCWCSTTSRRPTRRRCCSSSSSPARSRTRGSWSWVPIARSTCVGITTAGDARRALRYDTTRRLTLGGLTELDVSRFLSLTTELDAAEPLAAAIHDRTEGNPLFVDEVVRLLAAQGRLVGLEDAGRPAIPPTVREVIAQRLAHLPEACTDLLMRAAVVGREFSLLTLGRVAGDEPLDVLDPALAAHVVVEVPEVRGRLRFSHGLIRDALYEELPPGQRSRTHRRIGEVLERVYAPDPDTHAAELAYHFFEGAQSGDADKALRYAIVAGDRAGASLAYEEAVRLYRMGLELLDGLDAVDEQVRCDLLLAVGDAEMRAGDGDRAKESFWRAAEIARREQLRDRLARAALGYGGRFVWSRAGSDSRLVPLLEEALAAVEPGDSGVRAAVARAARRSVSRSALPRPGRRAQPRGRRGARRQANPAALAYALDGRHVVISGTRCAGGAGRDRGRAGRVGGRGRGRGARVPGPFLAPGGGPGARRPDRGARRARCGDAHRPEAQAAGAAVVRRRHRGAAGAPRGQLRRGRGPDRARARPGPAGAELGGTGVLPDADVRAAQRAGPPRGARGDHRAVARGVPGLSDLPLRAGRPSTTSWVESWSAPRRSRRWPPTTSPRSPATRSGCTA